MKEQKMQRQSGKTLLKALGIALVCMNLVVVWGAEKEPDVFWSADFNDPRFFKETCKAFYEGKASGKAGDQLFNAEVQNGALVCSLKFEADRVGDRANLLFGDNVWWDSQKSKWGPVDLKKYPILEITWRGDNAQFCYDMEIASGERKQGYTYLSALPFTKVTGSDGKEWKVSTWRGAADSSVPSENTPIKLRGISFHLCLYDNRSTNLSLKISALRVRALNPEEARREQNVIKILKDYRRPECGITKEFFPFGVFGVGFLNTFEYWGGKYSGAYGWIGRNYFNCMAEDSEMQFTRNWKNGQDLPGAIEAVKKQVAYARENGLKYVADLRYISSGIDVTADEGFQSLKKRTELIAKAFDGDTTVLGWYLSDEPSTAHMLDLIAEKRAMDESGLEHKPVLMVFSYPAALAAYRAYLSVNYWDRYPVVHGARDPLAVKAMAKIYRQVVPELPAWAVLQVFENSRHPKLKEQQTLPTGAEIRLMSYAALAEGVKGLFYFMGWNGTGVEPGLVSRTGEPCKEMMDTCSELGRLLIPIGGLLLETDVDEKSGIDLVNTKDSHLSVGVLKHRERTFNYLVVVNENVNAVGAGKIKLGPGLKSQTLYDLNNLKPVIADNDGAFPVEPLAGGDGRIYLAADRKVCEEVSLTIRTGRVAEDLRVLLPDITILKKWGADLKSMNDALAKCNKALRERNISEAEMQVVCARENVNKAFEQDSVLNLCRRTLADMSHELRGLSLIAEKQEDDPQWWWGRKVGPMLAPNPAFLESSRKYWETGRKFSGIYDRYLLGQRESLWEDLMAAQLQLLSVREDLLTVLKKRLDQPQP